MMTGDEDLWRVAPIEIHLILAGGVRVPMEMKGYMRVLVGWKQTALQTTGDRPTGAWEAIIDGGGC